MVQLTLRKNTPPEWAWPNQVDTGLTRHKAVLEKDSKHGRDTAPGRVSVAGFEHGRGHKARNAGGI